MNAVPAGVARDHEQTEAAIIATGFDSTILRNSLYVDLSLGALAGAVASGTLVELDEATVRGDSKQVSSTVERIAGVGPTNVASFLRANRAALDLRG